jgi:hypothetical protein
MKLEDKIKKFQCNWKMVDYVKKCESCNGYNLKCSDYTNNDFLLDDKTKWLKANGDVTRFCKGFYKIDHDGAKYCLFNGPICAYKVDWYDLSGIKLACLYEGEK